MFFLRMVDFFLQYYNKPKCVVVNIVKIYPEKLKAAAYGGCRL